MCIIHLSCCKRLTVLNVRNLLALGVRRRRSGRTSLVLERSPTGRHGRTICGYRRYCQPFSPTPIIITQYTTYTRLSAQEASQVYMVALHRGREFGMIFTYRRGVCARSSIHGEHSQTFAGLAGCSPQQQLYFVTPYACFHPVVSSTTTTSRFYLKPLGVELCHQFGGSIGQFPLSRKLHRIHRRGRGISYGCEFEA